ncbi:winged helix-turn-helix transcriptional regulator [Pseudomonas chlororaphis]|uniref:HxlR family transcriptional regulator n=1 Tax=Pseudomonas chlororaphis TaxID=587753 RepID=A0A1Q8EJH3_9PSED|nr:helix-turn-helix domain-containing protein [Pseudomonas chlororaphis]OLF51946.1 HxlR family transcriptional regulator [Pseudomonas chlororaphis]
MSDSLPLPSAGPLVIEETCPPRRIHSLLSTKWTSMVLYVLSFGAARTGQMLRCMPGISQKMLTQTLRELERDGLLERTVLQVMPPMVEYALTPLGWRFVEPLRALYAWADENADALDELVGNRRRAEPLTATSPGRG